MLTPPAQLKAPSPRLRRILAIAWLACFALAILAQIGASWRIYVHTQVILPAFAPLGMPMDAMYRAGAIHVAVSRINERDLDGSESLEQLAALVQGPDGEEVTFVLRENGQEQRRMRTAENRSKVYEDLHRTRQIVTQFVDVAVAALILFAAFMLRRRRFDDPVAILLSFALLFMAAVGSWMIWWWIGLPLAATFLPDITWLALLVIACPAFPSGRYLPRWTRWFIVGVPVGMAVLAVAVFASEMRLTTIAGLQALLVLTALLCVILRFRYTPPGDERQQMKWATLGLGVGLFLYAPTMLLELGIVVLPVPEPTGTIVLIAYALNRLSSVIIALGLLAPLLEYRLNDADAALGRSASYAAVTTMVSVVWAVSTVSVETLIKSFTANSYPGVAAGISTLIALAVFAPARTRALAWTEARFQRALVRLRSLPERIARWQLGDDPGVLANRALKAIADGVDADAAALVAQSDGEPPRIVGFHNIGPETVMERLGEGRPRARKADGFPLRIEMAEYGGRSLTLLIGPRSDGASYSRQERAAVSAIAEPLADAIDAVSRRAALNARLTGALADISDRLDQIPGKTPRRRRKSSAGLEPGR